MSLLEQKLEKKYVNKAKSIGWLSIKIGQDGWPDRMFISRKREVMFAEFKAPKKSLEPRQRARAMQLIELGFEVYRVRGVYPKHEVYRLTEKNVGKS